MISMNASLVKYKGEMFFNISPFFIYPNLCLASVDLFNACPI